MRNTNHDQNLPDAEIGYHAFRSEFNKWFDSLDKGQRHFYWDDAPERRIDSRVNYPLDFTHAMVDTTLGEAPASSDPLSRVGQFLHAFGNYSKTRTIYTIDQTLFAHLVGSKWPKDIPMSAAALPKNGCVLDLPAHEVFGSENIKSSERIQIVCTYDMNYETGDLDMVLTAMSINRSLPGKPLMSLDGLNAWINLASANLEEAIFDYAVFMEGAPERIRGWIEKNGVSWAEIPDEGDAKVRETRLFSKEWYHYLKSILSVLLYINGNHDLMELKAPNPVPMNKSARRRLAKKAPSDKAEAAPLRNFQVGGKFASVIQRWCKEEKAEAESTGRMVRPHLRAAHIHRYWIGQGKTDMVVRFLLPISVKGWKAPEKNPANRLVR